MNSKEELDAQDRLNGEREGMRFGTPFGLEVGRRALFNELLWSRFKRVPEEIVARVSSASEEEIVARVSSASEEEIERWSDRFVALLSVESVFRE